MRDLFDGDLVVQRNDDGTVDVIRAEPRITIAAELVDLLRSTQAEHPSEYIVLDGEVLKVHGRNRTVVYRILGPVHDKLAYYAEWPD